MRDGLPLLVFTVSPRLMSLFTPAMETTLPVNAFVPQLQRILELYQKQDAALRDNGIDIRENRDHSVVAGNERGNRAEELHEVHKHDSKLGNSEQKDLAAFQNMNDQRFREERDKRKQDLEKALRVNLEPPGFPSVVNFIAQDPDQETFVFRKFNTLTAWSLVFKQNELASLEKDLRQLQYRMETDPDGLRSEMEWTRFEERASMEGTIERDAVVLTERITQKLNDIPDSALVSASTIAHLKEPTKRVVNVFHDAIKKLEVKGDLIGEFIEEEKHRNDLVALKRAADNDTVTTFLRDYWPQRWAKNLSKAYTPSARFFEDKIVTRIARAFSVLLAVLLLVGSIRTLYYVTNDGTKLGLLMMYIVVFAFGVAITTGAKRDSILAATAAYAAVLIVFISGDLNNSDAMVSSALQGSITEAVRQAIEEANLTTV